MISRYLSCRLVRRRVSRLMKAGDLEGAIRLAGWYRRVAWRNPSGYLLEYHAINRRTAVDRRAQLELLRTGWKHAPYHGLLADALLTELHREDCSRPDPALRAEARTVLDQMVSLFGDGQWVCLWLAELAQLDGDWASAKQYAELALTMVEREDSQSWKGYVRVGLALASIPGEEQRGEQLLLESIQRYGDPWTRVHYALVVEERDPRAAAEQLAAAKEMCPPHDEAGFDRAVETARDHHRRNVARLRLAG